MITANIYTTYFGVSTAPTNLSRLEFISLEELKSIMTSAIPEETDDKYDTFLKALMEQMNYFDINNEILVYATNGGASLGKYNEGGQSYSQGANKPIVSPLAYKILLNLGYLYVGVC